MLALKNPKISEIEIFDLIVYKNFPKFPEKSKQFPETNGKGFFREIPGNSRVPTLTAA